MDTLSLTTDDPVDVGNLISDSSAFPKTSLNIWKFMVHVLLKPGLENFEHYFTGVGCHCLLRILMVKVRYICFYCTFLYSLAVFIILPKFGPEEEQKLMRFKNSIVKHQKWNLIITHSHHSNITHLPSWDLPDTQK